MNDTMIARRVGGRIKTDHARLPPPPEAAPAWDPVIEAAARSACSGFPWLEDAARHLPDAIRSRGRPTAEVAQVRAIIAAALADSHIPRKALAAYIGVTQQSVREAARRGKAWWPGDVAAAREAAARHIAHAGPTPPLVPAVPRPVSGGDLQEHEADLAAIERTRDMLERCRAQAAHHQAEAIAHQTKVNHHQAKANEHARRTRIFEDVVAAWEAHQQAIGGEDRP